jgi:hypothetical protein
VHFLDMNCSDAWRIASFDGMDLYFAVDEVAARKVAGVDELMSSISLFFRHVFMILKVRCENIDERRRKLAANFVEI